jgi:hypothetical protein
MQSDVWVLENAEETYAINYINRLYDAAKKGNEMAQAMLMVFYDPSDWEEIQKRMETEGSVWYVWYMDGVHAFMQIVTEQEEENE